MKRILIAAAAAASTMSFGATNTVELKAGLSNYNDNLDAGSGDAYDGAVNSFGVARAKWKQAGDIDAGYSYKFSVNMLSSDTDGDLGLALESAVLNYTSGMHMVTVGRHGLGFGGAEDAATADIEMMVKSAVMSTAAAREYAMGLFYTASTEFGKVTLGVANQEQADADGQAFSNVLTYNGSFMGGNLLPVIQYATWSGMEDVATEDTETYMSLGLTYKVAGADITVAQHTMTTTFQADGADDKIESSMAIGLKYKTGDYRPYLNMITDIDDTNSDTKVTTATTNVGVVHDCGKGVGLQFDYASSKADTDGAEAETTISLAVNAVIKG